MQQIGYSLINSAGAEVLFWGDTAGTTTPFPSSFTLPTGEHICGAKPGEIGDFRMVPRKLAYGTPSIVFDGDAVIVTRSVTIDMIVRERERRLALGFDYNFGDSRGVHRIGTTKRDLEGWDEVSKYAGALIDAGQTSTQINVATDTGPCVVTPIEWRAIEIASAQYRQPLWAKSFALMASNPIPADYTNDSYWT